MSIDSVVISHDDIEDADATLNSLERAERLREERESDAERPDWLPDEFETLEDFLNDYNQRRELDNDEGEQTDEPADEAPDTDDADDDDESDESSQDETLDIDFDTLTSEFMELGTISEDSFAALEEVGIHRSVVEAHIQGLHAQAELTRMRAAESMGGQENLEAILQWAGQSLPQRDIDRVNALVADGDFDGYMLAMEGVKARYEAAYGATSSPALSGSVAPVVDVYGSQEEMKADMRDPRYSRDEAFRSRVAAKVARTRRQG